MATENKSWLKTTFICRSDINIFWGLIKSFFERKKTMPSKYDRQTNWNHLANSKDAYAFCLIITSFSNHKIIKIYEQSENGKGFFKIRFTYLIFIQKMYISKVQIELTCSSHLSFKRLRNIEYYYFLCSERVD